MRLFFNIFLIILLAASFPACSGCGEQTDGTETSSVEVDINNDQEGKTVFNTENKNPELQRDTNAIARAKAEALKKANEGKKNSHFKDIAPKTVKEKMVDKAASTNEKVEGQDYTRVTGATVSRVRAAPSKDKTPSSNANVNSGFTANSVKAADGSIVPRTTNDNTDNGQSDAPKTSTIHDLWNSLLSKNVNASGHVNYSGIKASKTQLDQYLNTLKQNPPQGSWSKAKTMAYWINAYNAFTIKLVIDNMPLKSIKDLDGGKVWDRKWIKIGNQSYSLNNIENDILRPKYKDARIHFAVNCAAKSCPPIWNRAWTAQNLERSLEDRTKIFIDNDKYNNIFETKAQISKIFEWYASDFSNLITFLNKYTTEHLATNAKITYMDYDWALNGK